MSEANNITFAQAKTSFFYRPKVKRKYNTLHLAGKKVCKKDEVSLVLFELNIKLLYGRYPKSTFFAEMISLFYLFIVHQFIESDVKKRCYRFELNISYKSLA